MKKFENAMLNRRQALALGVSGAASLALAACGGGSSDGGATAADEAVEATVTVWGPQEDQSDDNGNWLQTECEAFAAEHPDWTLTFKYGVCSEGDAKTNIGTDPSAGADVYLYANDQIPDLLKAGGIAEFGGSTLDAIKANNSETTVNTVTYEGAVYGVPFTGNTWFMYYDKSVFSDDDIKSLDAMLEKGKVAFPLDNSWYIASFYVANGCTLFGASTPCSRRARSPSRWITPGTSHPSMWPTAARSSARTAATRLPASTSAATRPWRTPTTW